MASSSSSRTCRLCRSLVGANRALHLFTSKGVSKGLAGRITKLLEVPVASDDRLPPYVCETCIKRITRMEKALDDLAAFKDMARCSLSALDKTRQPIKRTKETSGEIGVSPNTLKQRPRAKQARKRLTFTCKLK